MSDMSLWPLTTMVLVHVPHLHKQQQQRAWLTRRKQRMIEHHASSSALQPNH